MNADATGNDLTLTAKPIGGFVAIAYADITGKPPVVPSEADMAKAALTLTAYDATTHPEGWRYLGLFPGDNGPKQSTKFGALKPYWQSQYKQRTGDGEHSRTYTMAEVLSSLLAEIRSGGPADASGVSYVDAVGTDRRWVVLEEKHFASGAIQREWGEATVSEIKTSESKSGEDETAEVTFDFSRSAIAGGRHFGHVVVLPVTP